MAELMEEHAARAVASDQNADARRSTSCNSSAEAAPADEFLDSMQSLRRYLLPNLYAADASYSADEPPDRAILELLLSDRDDDQKLAEASPIRHFPTASSWPLDDDGIDALSAPFAFALGTRSQHQRDRNCFCATCNGYEALLLADKNSIQGLMMDLGTSDPSQCERDQDQSMHTQFVSNVDQEACDTTPIKPDAAVSNAKKENSSGHDEGGDVGQERSVIWRPAGSLMRSGASAESNVMKYMGQNRRKLLASHVGKSNNQAHQDDDVGGDSEKFGIDSSTVGGEYRKRGQRQVQPKKSKNLVSERRRRQKLNERLYALRALVPNISKMDKASIVIDAIDYVRDLKKQLQNTEEDIAHLEACRESMARCIHATNTKPKAMLRAASHQPSRPIKSVHWILEMHVNQMEENLFQFRMRCKKTPRILLQLARALESLNITILNGSLTSMKDFVLNTLVIEVEDGHRLKSEDLKEKILEAVAKFGIFLWRNEHNPKQ